MTTLKSITDYHEAILQRFLEYRQDNPYFNFNLRKKDGKNERLRNGYWFQGDDTYISASPFILGSYINKTPAIYICLEDKKNKFIDSEKVATEFWVVRDETLKTTDENLFNFFGRLLDDGELFPQDVQHIDNKNHNRQTKTRIFPSFDAVLNFLFEAIPKIERIAAECGVRQEDLYLNADEFNKRYSKVEDIKNGVYVKPEEDENTMESNNPLLEKSEEELLEEYYNFVRARVETENTAANYRDIIRKDVAPKFIKEGDEKVKQLFNCSVSEIRAFHESCKQGGENYEWNWNYGSNRRGNRPSATLPLLIEFLENREHKDVVPVVREKEKSEEELLEEFRHFLHNERKVEIYKIYIKNFVDEVVPKFIKEGDEKVKQLFNCPVSQINKFYESCKRGSENYEWNRRNGNGLPSAILYNLAKFLEYHGGNLQDVTPVVREKGKSEEELLEEYYNFVRPRVKWESTAASYRDVLRKDIAPKFIKEGDEKVKQLFDCPVSEIKEFRESCLTGRENYEWNKNIGDRTPSGALSQLIKFLEYRKENPDTPIPVVHEKEKSEEELLEEYYNFVRDEVDTEQTAARYRDFLKKDVAPKFITEGNEKVKQLFNCSVSQIREWRESCLTGENREWNSGRTGNKPHQALKYLIDFLEEHKENPDTEIPEVRENTDVFPDEVPPLNRIFYGPPGTGKTYNTTKHALDIIDGEEVNNKRAPAEQKQRFAELQEQEEEQIAMVTFHQNFAYEDFIEGIKPVLEKNTGKKNTGTVSYKLEDGLFKSIAVRANKNRQKNFVLIIDEINRGNISKILGELITLIERSKRLGNEDKLKLALPYSKDLFGVPRNLYIIGTMNTADRSLAQLDTALRRRFNFIEMMPDSSHIIETLEGVELKQLLEAMNERIIAKYSREHQIGHAYFMEVNNLEALKDCFQQKVIPLLQEYFFNDWGKIQEVLNNNGFVRKFSKEDEEDNPIYDSLPYKDEAWDNPKNYIAIYQSQSSTDTTDTTDE